jgi:UDP-N-acetylmuramoyl-tripeptide--D-alanyl-D-alanine ligase
LHHVQNALAAAAVAHGLGVAPQAIATGLAAHRPVKQRMQIHRLQGGGVLIDDTYNANPMSVLAAVRTLMAASGGRQAIAVLGEMRELGPDSALLHRDLGRQIARLGISRLATLGELAAEISMGAQEAGMKAENCYHGRSHEDLVSWLRGRNLGDGWVLVKGSRGMTMERVVEGVLA